MVYSDQNHYIVTSAACGPSFEGGHMKCGIGAVAGAVDKVWYDQRLNTIRFKINEQLVFAEMGIFPGLRHC